MVKDEKLDKSNDEIIRRLDIIAIFLLAQKGLSQKEIAKTLAISDRRIQEIFGDRYKKIQTETKKNNIKKIRKK